MKKIKIPEERKNIFTCDKCGSSDILREVNSYFRICSMDKKSQTQITYICKCNKCGSSFEKTEIK